MKKNSIVGLRCNMNYLFWNANQKQGVNNIIFNIILKHNCDIIGLAEYNDDIKKLISSLAKEEIYMYEVPIIGCRRLHILTKFIPEKIKPLPESDHYTLKLIPHETLGSHIIAFVHLSSKLGKPNDLDHTIEMYNLRKA